MDHYTEAILAKYDRAKKHIDDLNIAIEAFRANNYPVRKERDPESGDVTYCITRPPKIPPEIALLLGDAIHNLRGTLDYLAHGLILASGGTPHQHTSFPIFDTAEFYAQTAASKVPGLRQPCMEKLDRLQPYKGGWGNILWQLHKLDIRDKHCLLLTMCVRPIARTLTPSEISGRPTGPPMALYTDVFTGNPRYVALEEGEKLLTVSASEANEDVRFSFDVAIYEKGILEGMPIWMFLRSVSSEVINLITGLGPVCSCTQPFPPS